MNVIVTGGTSFVGKRLNKVKPDWTYLSSSDYDLTNQDDCKRMISDTKPDAIIHLAGRVGGIKENMQHQGDFFYSNTIMGMNVLHAAHEAGVKRVLVCLSTCAWPKTVEKYPFTENDILNGPPEESNLGYSYSKRALYIQVLTYRNQYGHNYSCFSPSNLYGPGMNYDENSSHFVAALIRKVAETKDGKIEMWGTGKPLRQQLYVDDLAVIIPELLEKHNSDIPVIVAPDENLSIKEMCELLANQVGKEITFTFNNKMDGQYRKDGSNEKLLETIGEFTFTSFKDGVLKEYNQFKDTNS